MHHKELNHKVHTWLKSDEFCREFGESSRLVEVHSLEQKERIDQLVGWLIKNTFHILDNIWYNDNTASEGYYYHWTGATDKNQEGDWVWGSTGGSGQPVQDFVWAPSKLPLI